MDYSKTVHLPKTDFPMKANLSQREPQILESWNKSNIYKKLLSRNSGNKTYVLHDGPPYANGHIHIGTALNKILKDVTVKYRSMNGYFTPYIPGWDCHGMPIEHQIFQDLKLEKSSVDVVKFRKKAAKYALKFVDIQREEFKRLGILGEWENPYLTLSFDYEADIVKAFGILFLKKYIYRAFKPIHWCMNCETALAEAEIEYSDEASPSIYVRFPVRKEYEKTVGENVSFLIWTTTPWTLPANMGIALCPRSEYSAVKTPEGTIIIASALVKDVLARKDLTGNIVKTFKGAELENIVCTNPLTTKDSLVVLADYVSMEDGTGCVHTAPGHGEEDYYTGIKYNLTILSPIDEKGRFTEQVTEFQGLQVFEADKHIVEKLDKLGALYFEEQGSHSYPHCWRCKKPVIFRSTEQWFLKIDHANLRNLLQEEIRQTKWIPEESEKRISSMVETRPDWCLSRQRLWGVPLPVFYCMQCSKSIITDETVKHVENLFRENGSDIWFEKKAEELLPAEFSCPHCGEKDFRKEKDILDVWFDSGISHFTVLKQENGLSSPADLYLEGSDQHRGWFQSSLITSCGIFSKAPYKQVLTHGFVVDSAGKKMSKSLGNVITPEQIIKNQGAEILRIWSVSENYRQDVRISDEILKSIVTSYRNIRNTIRFMLGNLSDFTASNAVSEKDLCEVDKWAIEKLKDEISGVTGDYEEFAFYKAYGRIYEFCNIYLSSFYLDYLKDRLYTCGQNSRTRRAAQTVLNNILEVLLILTAPMLSFMAEEAYGHLPDRQKESIFLMEWPEYEKPDKELLERWNKFFEFRKTVLRKLEEKRTEKIIRSNLEAKVIVEANEQWHEFLLSFNELSGLLMISEVDIQKGQKELEITIEKTLNNKCARCWIHCPTVGKSETFTEICEKCIVAIKEDTDDSKNS